MTDWASLMKNKPFITDLGDNQSAQISGTEVTLGRYAVWSPVTNSDGHQVVEVGADLQELMRKHNIPTERVCKLATTAGVE